MIGFARLHDRFLLQKKKNEKKKKRVSARARGKASEGESHLGGRKRRSRGIPNDLRRVILEGSPSRASIPYLSNSGSMVTINGTLLSSLLQRPGLSRACRGISVSSSL